MASRASNKRTSIKTVSSRKISAVGRAAKRSAKSIGSKLDRRMQTIADMTRSVSGAVQGTKQSLNSAKRVLRSDFNRARAKLNLVQKQTESYVAKNPKKAAAIAAGIGAAIGAAIAAYYMKQKSAGGARR